MDKKILSLLGGLGTATVVRNWMKFCQMDGTKVDPIRYSVPITGTDIVDWFKIKEKDKWVLLRGSHFLSVYNQIYHYQLRMGIGPIFYYSTIHSPIL